MPNDLFDREFVGHVVGIDFDRDSNRRTPVARFGLARHRGLEQSDSAANRSRRERQQNLFFVGEVVVDRAARAPHLFRDGVHVDRPHSAASQHRKGFVENA